MEQYNYIDLERAGKQLGVHAESVRRYYRSGILRGRRIGRKIFVEQNAVLSLMKVMKWCDAGRPVLPCRLVRQAKRAAAEASA